MKMRTIYKKMSYKKPSKNTTQITPNWFPNGSLTSPETTQENQFGSTRGLRYGPLRINKTGIFVNNGTLDSTIITDTGFHGYGLSGIEQITLDASTGLNVTDGSNSVLQAVVSGTNVGDVVLGDYSGGKGAFYDKSAGKFYIKGTLEAVDGTFSGSISIGSGDNIFKADSNGIYLGNATFASAPFRVNMSGALTATNATITGSITSTSGTIGGWTIGSTTLSGSNVVLDSGGMILVGNSSTNVSLLMSGGSPYLSFMLSGSVKALLSATSAGNGGVKVNGGDLVLDNNKSLLIATDNGYGGISVTSDEHLWITCGNSNQFFVKNRAQDEDLFAVSSSGQPQAKAESIKLGNQTFALYNGNCTVSNNTLDLPNGKQLYIGTGSNFSINGNSKSAIVPTSQGYNALYCAEAPEVWFFDFCETKKKIDPMFLEVTEGKMRFIKCDKGYQVWRRRKGHAHKRFEHKSALQFYKNEAFLSLAK